MRKRRSLLNDNVVGSPSSSGGANAAINDQQQQPMVASTSGGGGGGNHFYHSHQHHNAMPPLNDAYEKSSREFEDIFDIDIDCLPASFFAEALGSLTGEITNDSSLLNEDLFLDVCTSRCVKRCYSAPPSPLSGLLVDFDEQSSMLDLINDAQAVADASVINCPTGLVNLPPAGGAFKEYSASLSSLPNNHHVDPLDDGSNEALPWASLTANDVMDVLEAATQRLTAEQLQQEANAAVTQQQQQQSPQQLPRPPSAPPPTTYFAPPPLPPLGSQSTRSDDAFSVDGFAMTSNIIQNSRGSNEWRQPRRPRSTVPTASLNTIPVSTVRRHDLVRSRLASLATRRLRDKLNASTSSDRSPLSISSDQFPYDFDSSSRHSSSSTPAMLTPVIVQQPSSSSSSFSLGAAAVVQSQQKQQQPPASSLATLLAPSAMTASLNGVVEARGGIAPPPNVVAGLKSVPPVSSNGGGADLYRCFYPSCSLSYDRPLRLSAHLLHHVYGMSGPYRCDVPTCSFPNNAGASGQSSFSFSSSAASSAAKQGRTFPTTKQLWAHVESAHPEIIENKSDFIQPVDFMALRHKSPVQCPSCDSSFVYSFQLFLHLRSVHVRPSHRSSFIAEKRSRLALPPGNSSSSFKPIQAPLATPFLCRLCGFQSSTMSALLLHIQRRQHRQAASRMPLFTNASSSTATATTLTTPTTATALAAALRGSTLASNVFNNRRNNAQVIQRPVVLRATVAPHQIKTSIPIATSSLPSTSTLTNVSHLNGAINGTTAYLVDPTRTDLVLLVSPTTASGINPNQQGFVAQPTTLATSSTTSTNSSTAPAAAGKLTTPNNNDNNNTNSNSNTGEPNSPFYLLQRVVLVNVSQ